MAVQAGFLKSLEYFAGLSETELEPLKRLFFEKTYARGETIALEGEAGTALFFVVSGAVKLFKTSVGGKEQILRIVRPGESFNEIALFDGEANPFGAQAMTEVTLLGLKKEHLDAVLREHPRIALNVIRVLAARLRQSIALVEDLAFRRVISRVARVLLEYAGNRAVPGARLTQQEMAALAGTAREVVARSLKTLEDEGIIRVERNQIIVKDRDALEKKAAESL